MKFQESENLQQKQTNICLHFLLIADRIDVFMRA